MYGTFTTYFALDEEDVDEEDVDVAAASSSAAAPGRNSSCSILGRTSASAAPPASIIRFASSGDIVRTVPLVAALSSAWTTGHGGDPGPNAGTTPSIASVSSSATATEEEEEEEEEADVPTVDDLVVRFGGARERSVARDGSLARRDRARGADAAASAGWNASVDAMVGGGEVWRRRAMVAEAYFLLTSRPVSRQKNPLSTNKSARGAHRAPGARPRRTRADADVATSV
jgi:hypothetical protein